MQATAPLWLQVLLYAGAFFVLNMAVARLWVRNPGPQNSALMALLGVVGILQLLYAGFASGVYQHLSFLMLWHVPALLAVGPLTTRVVSFFLPGSDQRIGTGWHLLPAAAAIVLLLPYFALDGATKLAFLEKGISFQQWPYFAVVVPLLLIGSFLSAAAYLGVTLARTFFLWKPVTIRTAPHVRVVALFVALAFAAAFVGLAAQIWAPTYKALSSLLLSLAFVLAYHVGHRDPTFLLGLRSEIRAARYAQTSLGTLKVDEVLGRLESVMENDRPFYDEDLSLEALARLVRVRPQQLSEILNVRIGEGFYEYVNRHRVQAAQAMLTEEPERSVLSVAYAVGFNSRSSFYTCFAKETGMTPSQFRRRASANAG